MKKLLIWLLISFLFLSGVYAWESRDHLLDTYGTQWEGYVNLIDNFIDKNKDNREKLEALQSKIVTILWSYNFKNTTKDKKTKAVIEFLFEAITDELTFWWLEELEDNTYRFDYTDDSGNYGVYEVKNGMYNGSFWVYDLEDNLVSVSTYKDNVLDGYANLYYPWWTQMEEILTFKDGALEWAYVKYYEQWEIKSEENYKNNVLDGEQKYYYDDWQLSKLENLKMWVRHGKYQEWYNDWQIQVEDNSIDGKFVWKATQWYMNGQKKFESQYNENGKLHWKATSWYSNGQINIQDNWENGVLNWLRTIYSDSTGVSKTEVRYEYGIEKSRRVILPDDAMDFINNIGY